MTAGVTVIEGGSIAYLRMTRASVSCSIHKLAGPRFNLSANGVRLTLQAS